MCQAATAHRRRESGPRVWLQDLQCRESASICLRGHLHSWPTVSSNLSGNSFISLTHISNSRYADRVERALTKAPTHHSYHPHTLAHDPIKRCHRSAVSTIPWTLNARAPLLVICYVAPFFLASRVISLSDRREGTARGDGRNTLSL